MAQPIKIAIIGGGPGGLATAIALDQQNALLAASSESPATKRAPLLDWTLYEKKPRISETGGGISLQRHTWRLLERFGVADNIDARDFFRRSDGQSGEQRDAITGVSNSRRFHTEDTPPHQTSCRIVRAKLQSALLKEVDRTRVEVDKKLVEVKPVSTSLGSRLRLVFADGFVDEVDLLVGADGIRSVVRQLVFPEHAIRYNGQSAYRTIVRKQDVHAINGFDLVWGPTFWTQNVVPGKYVFTCPLGNDDFEVTARIRLPSEGQEHVSWGRPYDFYQLLPSYNEFCPPLRSVLRLAAEAGTTQEFALFSGPRLSECIGTVAGDDKTEKDTKKASNIALLGDASHPLSGAFGAGAGFAFEDAYTLGRVLAWAFATPNTGHTLQDALDLYDRARSPHYANLYKAIDEFTVDLKETSTEGKPAKPAPKNRDWMYYFKADEVIEELIKEADAATGTKGEGGQAATNGEKEKEVVVLNA